MSSYYLIYGGKYDSIVPSWGKYWYLTGEKNREGGRWMRGRGGGGEGSIFNICFLFTAADQYVGRGFTKSGAVFLINKPFSRQIATKDKCDLIGTKL